MKKITLPDGYAMEVDEAALDDMDLVDAMSDLMDEDNVLALSRVARLLLGKSGYAALKAHFRGDGQRVPTGKISEAIGEILRQMGDDTKN